jgi:protein-tyrosine phosphatase
MRSKPFTILTVCRANVCRSPMIEHLLRQASSAAGLSWIVSSAGTHAVPGLPCHPYTSRVLRDRGIDPSPFRTTVLTTDAIEVADLILTADLEQRRQVAMMSPGSVGRTFPLLVFAEWLWRDTAAGYAPSADGNLIGQALRGRSISQPLPLARQILVDPLGRRLHHFRLCAKQIDQAVGIVVGTALAAQPESGQSEPEAADTVPAKLNSANSDSAERDLRDSDRAGSADQAP